MNKFETDTINEISGNDGSIGVYVQENDSTRRYIQFWSEEQTKYMMKLYDDNIKKIGPSKRFRIKKLMWMHIASIMSDKFGRDFSAMQVENRYKNEKRKKKDRNAPTSFNISSSYDHQSEDIRDIDDFISPEVEVMRSRTSVKKSDHSSDSYYNTNEIPCTTPPFLFGGKNDEIVLKYMKQQQEFFKEKERTKQKRHDEKIAVLKGIGESLQRLLERKRKYSS